MFYKKLNGDSNNENTNCTPDQNESREFCKKIQAINKVHNKDAERLSNIKSELLDLDCEQEMMISEKDLKNILQKLPHWKAPGKDGLQGYQIKAFKSLHNQLLKVLNLCFESGKIPDWMVSGKTVLIHKDYSKGIIPSNYQPITCLQNIWKILTGIISNKMYESLDETKVLTGE